MGGVSLGRCRTSAHAPPSSLVHYEYRTRLVLLPVVNARAPRERDALRVQPVRWMWPLVLTHVSAFAAHSGTGPFCDAWLVLRAATAKGAVAKENARAYWR